jgi:serine/threonine protein kinase
MNDVPQPLASALTDRYLLEREVGAGGMATVYLARDLRHKRSVAVKVIRPELAGRDGIERFLREIELVAGLQHPNILPVFDSGVGHAYELGGQRDLGDAVVQQILEIVGQGRSGVAR